MDWPRTFINIDSRPNRFEKKGDFVLFVASIGCTPGASDLGEAISSVCSTVNKRSIWNTHWLKIDKNLRMVQVTKKWVHGTTMLIKHCESVQRYSLWIWLRASGSLVVLTKLSVFQLTLVFVSSHAFSLKYSRWLISKYYFTFCFYCSMKRKMLKLSLNVVKEILEMS